MKKINNSKLLKNISVTFLLAVMLIITIAKSFHRHTEIKQTESKYPSNSKHSNHSEITESKCNICDYLFAKDSDINTFFLFTTLKNIYCKQIFSFCNNFSSYYYLKPTGRGPPTVI